MKSCPVKISIRRGENGARVAFAAEPFPLSPEMATGTASYETATAELFVRMREEGP